jgi:heat shock protein HslJ
MIGAVGEGERSRHPRPSVIVDASRPARDTRRSTVARVLHGRRALWTAGAVVLLCATVSAAATRPAGRRGKQRTPAAEDAAAPLPEAPKPPPTPLDGTRWQLRSYRGRNGETVTPLDGSRPTIRFRDARIVTGSGGCNTFSAGYTYDDGRLTLSHPAAASNSCPDPAMDQEAAYLAALHRVAGFSLSENALTLDDSRAITLLTFEPEPPPVLVGTDWRLTAYNDGKGGFVPTLRDVSVTATFGADGKVSGSGGCNEDRGKYTQTGENLLIGTLILMTRKACPAEIRDQERAYLAGLRSATRAEGTGGELLLTRAGDTRVATYRAAAPAK